MHCRHICALYKCSKILLFIENILALHRIYIFGEMEILLRRIKPEEITEDVY